MTNPACLPKSACLAYPHSSPTQILQSKVYLSHVLFSWGPYVGQVCSRKNPWLIVFKCFSFKSSLEEVIKIKWYKISIIALWPIKYYYIWVVVIIMLFLTAQNSMNLCDLNYLVCFSLGGRQGWKHWSPLQHWSPVGHYSPAGTKCHLNKDFSKAPLQLKKVINNSNMVIKELFWGRAAMGETLVLKFWCWYWIELGMICPAFQEYNYRRN